MDRLLLTITITFSIIADIAGIPQHKPSPQVSYSIYNKQDTSLFEKQLLFNGRIWKNQYSAVVGDEFFLTKEWIEGEVNINDAEFKGIPLKYDIYNDQLISIINAGTFIQLNKELIKDFTLSYEDKKYHFENFGEIPDNTFKGFGQVLYSGKISLILKYFKEIKELAVQNRYDKFTENKNLYILKDGVFYRISGKHELLKTLSDKEEELQSFIRENKIRVRKSNPDSFIPVLEYYNNLK